MNQSPILLAAIAATFFIAGVVKGVKKHGNDFANIKEIAETYKAES